MIDQNHPMWDHINASLKGKVDILAKNPYRFYIGPNVWAFRNSRIKILEDYLKEANALEDYKLCQKIKEVKTFLGFINKHKTNRDYVFIIETEQTMWDVDVRYYLKKEDNILKLYSTKDTNEEFHDCEASLKINDSLSKRDVIELIEEYFGKWQTYGGLPRFREEGLLDEKEFYAIIDIIKEKRDYQRKLLLYLLKTEPNKLKFNPRVAKVEDNYILFGMSKHYGTLSLSKKLLENLDSENPK